MFHAWPVKIISTAASSRPMLLRGERGDQRQHQARHEAEHGDALEDVEERDQDALGDVILGRPVAVDQREDEREHVGDEAAREREEGVARQRQRREVDVDLRAEGPRPLDAHLAETEEQPREPHRDGEVHQRRPATVRALRVRPPPDVGEAGQHGLGHDARRVARRVEQSKIAHHPAESKGGISRLRSGAVRGRHNPRRGLGSELAWILLGQMGEAPATDAPPPSTWRFFFFHRVSRCSTARAPAGA